MPNRPYSWSKGKGPGSGFQSIPSAWKACSSSCPCGLSFQNFFCSKSKCSGHLSPNMFSLFFKLIVLASSSSGLRPACCCKLGRRTTATTRAAASLESSSVSASVSSLCSGFQQSSTLRRPGFTQGPTAEIVLTLELGSGSSCSCLGKRGLLRTAPERRLATSGPDLSSFHSDPWWLASWSSYLHSGHPLLGSHFYNATASAGSGISWDLLSEHLFFQSFY